MHRAIRLGLAFTLAACALCQDRPNPSAAAYAFVFAQVADLQASDRTPPAPGPDGSPAPIRPSVQDVFGISRDEAQLLIATARDCGAGDRALQEQKAALVFQSRLDFIETGKHSDNLDEQMKNVDAQHDQMILAHVRELKEKLPAAAFDKIVGYVRTPVDERKPLQSNGGGSTRGRAAKAAHGVRRSLRRNMWVLICSNGGRKLG